MSEQVLHFVKKSSYARVGNKKVARLRYVVVDVDANKPIEFRDDLYYLHGGYGGAFPKVEEALEGCPVGERVEVSLSPEEGYGLRDEGLVMTIPKAQLPEEAHQVGARIEGETPDGHTVAFGVVEVSEESLTIDGNHPMAGKNLMLTLEVLEVRDASEEELKVGYAFAPTPSDPPAGKPTTH